MSALKFNTGGIMIGELTVAQKERREKILNSATKHFAKIGFCSTDMDKIAKNAGVGKGYLSAVVLPQDRKGDPPGYQRALHHWR